MRACELRYRVKTEVEGCRFGGKNSLPKWWTSPKALKTPFRETHGRGSQEFPEGADRGTECETTELEPGGPEKKWYRLTFLRLESHWTVAMQRADALLHAPESTGNSITGRAYVPRGQRFPVAEPAIPWRTRDRSWATRRSSVACWSTDRRSRPWPGAAGSRPQGWC